MISPQAGKPPRERKTCGTSEIRSHPERSGDEWNWKWLFDFDCACFVCIYFYVFIIFFVHHSTRTTSRDPNNDNLRRGNRTRFSFRISVVRGAAATWRRQLCSRLMGIGRWADEVVRVRKNRYSCRVIEYEKNISDGRGRLQQCYQRAYNYLTTKWIYWI